MNSPYGQHLPIFPCLDYERLHGERTISADRIERACERLMDRADAVFMRGDATQEQYDKWVRRLNEWADELYAKFGRGLVVIGS